MKIIFAILAILLVLSSCRTVEKSVERYDSIETTVVIKDSIIVIQADSALVQAWFRCDSLNKVVLSQLDMEKGREIKPIVRWNERLQTIIVEAKVDSQAIGLKWAEMNVKETKAETIIVTETKVIKHVPWFYKAMSTLGILPILYLLYKLWPVIRKILIKI